MINTPVIRDIVPGTAQSFVLEIIQYDYYCLILKCKFIIIIQFITYHTQLELKLTDKVKMRLFMIFFCDPVTRLFQHSHVSFDEV